MKLFKGGTLRCVGTWLGLAGIVMLFAGAFLNGVIPDLFIDGATIEMIIKMSGLVFFLVGGMILSLTSDKHSLIKALLVFFVAVLWLTWILPYGMYQGADFYENGIQRLGLADVAYTMYHAIDFILDKIIYLIALAGFYGVISKTSGYQKLVNKMANCFKKTTVSTAITAVIMSVIIVLLTTLFTQSLMVLVILPFVISILLKMNLDKLTAFAVAFGSVLVGVLGCTYGTETLAAFGQYTSTTFSTGLIYRYIILGIGLILYNFFLVMRIIKIRKETKKNTKNSVVEDDPFKVEDTKEKANIIPVIIVLALVAIILILGYIDWEAYFGIKIFNVFHDMLIKLEAAKDVPIFSYILGAEAQALGKFPFVFTFGIVLLLASILVAFLYRMKLNEYFESFLEGLKAMYKPILVLIGIYMIFGVTYMVPVIPTIANWIANMVHGFNPYITSLIAFITPVFQIDMGYVGYTLSGLITTTYADNIVTAHTIFMSMYGLAQMIMPTSVIMAIGLSLNKVNYKDWFKYIWLFVLGMLVILLVLFTVITYVA